MSDLMPGWWPKPWPWDDDIDLTVDYREDNWRPENIGDVPAAARIDWWDCPDHKGWECGPGCDCPFGEEPALTEVPAVLAEAIHCHNPGTSIEVVLCGWAIAYGRIEAA